MSFLEKKRLPSGIVLLNSIFGCIPAGSLGSNTPAVPVVGTSTLVSSGVSVEESEEVPQVEVQLKEILYSLEILGIKSSELEDCIGQMLQRFRKTLRFGNNRFVVRWPWKVENPRLPTHYRICLCRLQSLFKSTPSEILESCDRLFKE